jgi:hypothetical protein
MLYRLPLVALVLLAFGGLAQAATINGFTDVFAPGNWTILSSNSNGSTVFSLPDSVTVNGTDLGGGGAGSQGLYMSSPGDYTISFAWGYATNDPGWDPSYYANGSWTFLSQSSSDSGFLSFSVNTGDLLGWKVDSVDNIFGAGYLTVSKFSATTTAAVPTPSSLLLLGGGLVGLAGFGRKKVKK